MSAERSPTQPHKDKGTIDKIRLINARKETRKEREDYEEG